MYTHKSRIVCLFLTVVLLALSGCWTLSVNPLYTESDIVYDDALEGLWGNPDNPEDETWEFKSAGEDSYRLVVRPEGKQQLLIDPETDGLFEVRMLQLDGHRFIDLFPEEPEKVNSFYKSHVIPAHSFARISIEGNVLRLVALDTEWLEEQDNQELLDISHVRQSDVIYLTASTEELQAWVLEHIDEAFDDVSVQTRLQ